MIDMAGRSFRDFNQGKLEESKKYGVEPRDWEDHLTTAFPEVRLKSYIELRGADSVPPPLLYALASFWAGLLYDKGALDAAYDYIKHWSITDHQRFREEVPEKGLLCEVPGRNALIRDEAPKILDIAEKGLARQANNKSGLVYLENLRGRLNGDAKIESCG